jgi:hypothetical protein
MRKVYLTLTAIIRDEEHYVKEWLTYYHLAGVERFVIGIHNTIDKTEERIKELPFFHKIFLHRIESEERSLQVRFYNSMFREYGIGKSEWVLFIDSDEFMLGRKKDDLKEIIADYEDFGGLSVHWKMFGANNYVVRPSDLCIESFTKCYPNPWITIKTFVKTNQAISLNSPHSAITIRPRVDENKKPTFSDPGTEDELPRTADIIQCNHYHTRSMEDWVSRAFRGGVNNQHWFREPDGIIFGANKFCDINNYSKAEDTEILRFANKIKEIINVK